MDFEKEREAFETFFYENCLTQWEQDMSEMLFQVLENGEYDYVRLQSSWLSWQAAKAQAVPGGFVVVPINNTTIVAVERMVEQQVEASGITADVFRLDGEKILNAAVEAARSGK